MQKSDFDAIKWCQELLATYRAPTGISTAMLNYVQGEVIDQEIADMDSYKQLKDWADEMGLVYEEIALTALRALSAEPPEGRMLLAIFRYLQLSTNKTLTNAHFLEFFESGMFTRESMIKAWNSQCSDDTDPELDSVVWSELVMRPN